jgi:hypothetical protein
MNGFTLRQSLRVAVFTTLISLLCLTSCGGSGSVFGISNNSTNGSGGGGSGNGGGPTGPNVQAVTIDSGPSAVVNSTRAIVNALYTSVTVCSPGSSTNCQTIDHIQVDTGSSGLRIAAAILSIQLPLQTDPNGNTVAECFPSTNGSRWGPFRQADIKIGGETANKQAVQVIGESAFAVPATCRAVNASGDAAITALGANGILGIGPYLQDCGAACLQQGLRIYYTCNSENICADSAMPLTLQIANPVASFATDNNGTIVELPAVSGSDRAGSGTLIFGIGTQSNNGLGHATVFTPSSSRTFSLTYKNSTLDQGVISSSLNAYYFPDDTVSVCAASDPTAKARGFFCPPATLNLRANLNGANGTVGNIDFKVDNAESLFKNAAPAVAPNLAGPSQGGELGNGLIFDRNRTFELGLPFYFGRTVYTGIEGRNSSAGLGPYVAF